MNLFKNLRSSIESLVPVFLQDSEEERVDSLPLFHFGHWFNCLNIQEVLDGLVSEASIMSVFVYWR